MTGKTKKSRSILLIRRDADIFLNSPPDGSADEAARFLAETLRVDFGIQAPILKGEKSPQIKHGTIITLGCMADNPLIRSLYLRFRTIVDRWYPGDGGYVLQSVYPAGGHEPRILIVGGSNQEGVMTAARSLAGLWRQKGKADVDWILRVKLGHEHLSSPSDRMDCFPMADAPIKLPEFTTHAGLEKPGYTGGSIRNYLLLLGMYGPHADNGHFSRSSQLALRYLYTGCDNDGQRYRNMLMDEIRQGIVKRLYHYKSVRMFQLWELLGPSRFFSREDRSVINNAIRDYLLHKTGAAVLDRIRHNSTGKGIFDRHLACDALNLWLGSDYFYRLTGKPRWMEYRKIADKYFHSQAGTDVSCTGLTEGYFTYLEVMLEWMLNACPERINADPHIRLWAERCLGLCTNQGVMVTGAQSNEMRYGYNLMRKLACLLKDGRYLYAADLRERAVMRGVDRVSQFSAGQAWAADICPEEPKDTIGLKVFPMNERLRKWVAPDVPKNTGFDRAVGRSGWGLNDEYFIVVGVRGGGKTLPNVGSLDSYERFGVRYIISPTNALLAGENNPWGYSTVTVTHNGAGGTFYSGAILLGQWSMSGLEFMGLKMHGEKTYDWYRTFCWRQESFLLVADMIRFRKPGKFTASANWRCARSMTIKDGRAWHDCVSPEGIHSRFWLETSVPDLLSDNKLRRREDVIPGVKAGGAVVLHAMVDGTTAAGKCVNLYTLLHATPDTRRPDYRLKPARNGIAIEGSGTAYILQDITSGNAPVVRRSNKIFLSSDREPIKFMSRPKHTWRKVSLASVWSARFGDKLRCWVADDKQVALGGEDGQCAVFGEKGRLLWQKDFSFPVTALCRLGDDLLVGTQDGNVTRCNAKGKEVWKYKCLFRPERHFWPWWFLPEPSIGALAAGFDVKTGKTYIAAGTGSCALNILAAENGKLAADVISPYGFPDNIKAHVMAGTGQLRFFVGHGRLTPDSSVIAWSPQADKTPPTRYGAVCGRDDLRSPGWDMCGVADFHIVSVEKNREKVLILRHGTFNQIAAYDALTAEPLWMHALGGSPVAFVIGDPDSRDGERITVAERFGWVSEFSSNGAPLGGRRVMEYIFGMAHDFQGRIILWNNTELAILEKDGGFRKAALSGTPMGWHKIGLHEGLMVFQERSVKLLSLA